MNLYGILIAVATFLIIGAFHPIVIKAEYYFSARCWPVFLISGIILIGASILIQNTLLSCIMGVTGCSCLWSIKELGEQKQRVAKGWFPENPARKDKVHDSSQKRS